MNETTFTLTPEVTTVVKDTGGNLGELGKQATIFTTAIFLVACVIALMLVLPKFALSDSGSSLNEGKKRITTVATVFFIVIITLSFFSYLNLLNFNYLDFSASGADTTKTLVSLQGTPVKETDATNNKPITTNDISFAQISANEADVRAVFARSGIKINALACTAVNQKNCTTVGGMSSKTIDMLIKLKSTCQCDMTISGGTEWWAHSMTTKHRPGNRTAVDLRKDAYLTNFIKGGRQNGFEPAVSWSTCYTAFTWNGFYFCDEKNTAAHWHVDPL